MIHPNTPAQADDLLKSIEREFERLASQALAIKSQRNALVPIGRLPPEVLAEIFYELVCSYDEQTYDKPQYWLAVTFVCRAWRAAALSAPRCWSHIHFRSDDYDRVTTFLQRSCSAPLQVSISMELPTPILQAVLGAMHRIQDLSFRLSPGVIELAEKGDGFAFNAPRLRRLTVKCCIPSSKTPLPTLSNASWPLLSSLDCTGASLNVVQAMVRPTLAELRVKERRPNTISAINWVNILGELPSLEKIYLEAVAPLDVPLRVVPKPTRQVTLPRLRTLDFTDPGNGTACATLLNHLVVSADTLMRLRTYKDCMKEEAEYILGAFAAKASGKDALGDPPRPALAMTFDTWRANGVYIGIYDEYLTTERTTRDGREVPGLDDYSERVLTSLYPLSKINIVGIRTTPLNIKTEGVWQAVSQLPDVREIEIVYDDDTAASFFSFMERSPVAFPKLERLALSAWKRSSWSKRERQKLADTLMSLLIRLSGDRKERGMEVKCLDIDFGGSMSSKDKSHRTLSKLGALVGEIRGIRQLRSHDDDK